MILERARALYDNARMGTVRSAVEDAAIEAAAEAATLSELAGGFLPILEEALGASGTLLFEFGDDGRPRGLSGSLAQHIAAYNESVLGEDPIQRALRRIEPRATTMLLEDVMSFRELRASPAFHEFYRPLRMERMVGVWPLARRFGDPGMVGLIVGRPRTARPFSRTERRLLDRVLPAMRGVIARDRRSRARDREAQYVALALEHVLPRPTFVLGRRGDVLWMSPRARELVARAPDATELVAGLADAARRRIRGRGEAWVAIATAVRTHDVRLALGDVDGAPAVVAEVVTATTCEDELLASARQLGMTGAEARVLACVARGLDNRSIAAELHVSEATVKTHLRQILGKLGVESRTQAALRVHGVLPPRRGDS